MAAYGCLRQVSFGLLDMAYYTRKEPFDEDIVAFEKKAWEKAIVLPQLPDTCMTVQFGHIMSGGYAAGYYSYKWAEVLDAERTDHRCTSEEKRYQKIMNYYLWVLTQRNNKSKKNKR